MPINTMHIQQKATGITTDVATIKEILLLPSPPSALEPSPSPLPSLPRNKIEI